MRLNTLVEDTCKKVVHRQELEAEKQPNSKKINMVRRRCWGYIVIIWGYHHCGLERKRLEENGKEREEDALRKI